MRRKPGYIPAKPKINIKAQTPHDSFIWMLFSAVKHKKDHWHVLKTWWKEAFPTAPLPKNIKLDQIRQLIQRGLLRKGYKNDASYYLRNSELLLKLIRDNVVTRLETYRNIIKEISPYQGV